MIRGVGVVVPVHDEEALLESCLQSLRHAVRRARSHVPTHVVVVLDACTDGSARIAENYARSDDFEIVATNRRNVGQARTIGIDHVLAHFAELGRSQLWLATTDADTLVPRSWITDHTAVAARGAHALTGVIRIRSGHRLALDHICAFRSFYDSFGGLEQHGHVHGANLGVRADAYLEVGGFQPLRTGEDQALVRSLRSADLRVVSSRRIEVATSGRLVGRAPSGFAGFLAAMPVP